MCIKTPHQRVDTKPGTETRNQNLNLASKMTSAGGENFETGSRKTGTVPSIKQKADVLLPNLRWLLRGVEPAGISSSRRAPAPVQGSDGARPAESVFLRARPHNNFRGRRREGEVEGESARERLPSWVEHKNMMNKRQPSCRVRPGESIF